MRIEITPVMVEGLWAHMVDEYFGELVCGDSRKMKAVRWALDCIKVRYRKDFLRTRGLTIGDTIYLPFVPGEKSARWPAHRQAEMIIHENCHVWQSLEYGGMIYSAGYLGNNPMRAHFEAEALKTNIEFGLWLTGSMPDPLPYARTVLEYGLDRVALQYVAEYLEQSRGAIAKGEKTIVTKVATEWLERNRNYPGA